LAVKLHRCPLTWLKMDGHACWRVQQALDEKGIDYEVVKESVLRPRRQEVKERTGQTAVPVLELEDGRWIREESKDLAAKIRAGELP
jgi:glutathione S-transferase